MQFTRLRLRGFKSFVDPTDIPIEPGLTGIVGPNGCGKSNLVEALRWVMGETSAKRMRGSGMEDVIFAGSARRPAHNIAEVAINLDNAGRTAPAQFNDLGELDVIRRIERDRGSTYRVNGKEVRARDVQLLFADQATGAGSTALVSQGRIGHIINAKPSERRHLLEEAAGISGLHSRRHEAELRLRAAETNLERLDDVLQTLESQLSTLQKQARQAKRYRRLSDDIHRNEAVLLHLDAEAAKAALAQARTRLEEAESQVATLTEQAAARSRVQAEAQAALPELREAEAAAAAEVQRLTLARQAVEQEERQVATARQQAEARLSQIDSDRERAEAQKADAAAAIARLDAEKAELDTAAAGEGEARAAADAALQAAQVAAQEAEAALGERNRAVAAAEAQARALDKRLSDIDRQRDKLHRQYEDAEHQRAELANAAEGDAEALARAAAAVEAADRELAEARQGAEAAESALTAARAEERDAQEAFQAAEAERSRLQAEIDALAGLLEPAQESERPPVLDALRAEPGSEAALGAALGDDLNAPLLDEDAPVGWRALPALESPPALPEGATPLSRFVSGPPALAQRLAQVGIVPDLDTGARLQAALRPGQRLVTQSGDLWRWDGFTAAADAPTAAAQRLEQKNRLSALRVRLPELESAAAEARTRHEAATAQAKDKAAAEKAARQAVNDAYRALERARSEHGRQEKDAATARERLASLDDRLERLAAEIAELDTARAQAESEKAELPDLAAAKDAVNELRAALAERRVELTEKQSARDRIVREAEARGQRLVSIAQEAASWRQRAEAADRHLAELDARAQAAREELDALAARPEELAGQRARLTESILAAESTRSAAADALARGESCLAEADKALKAAETELATAREERVRAEGGVEQAKAALDGVVERARDRLECPLSEVLHHARLDPGAELPERDEVTRTLQRLTKERDGIGAVNLRAEAEAAELEERIATMQSERADLTAAIARLRQGIASLNKEGRERLLTAFEQVNGHFSDLFVRLFGGGRAHLSLTESEDPLAAGLEIMASPPGKRLQVMSLLSGGEQTLTALALLFAVFLTNPAPICVLDEVDAPLDDANVDRFCTLVGELARAGDTRFLLVTHHRMTMSRVDRLFGVTMSERGVSQLVSVDLTEAEEMRESA